MKKKYTMDDFIAGKLVVRTGKGPNLEKFLDMCEKRGLKWHSGLSAKKYVPDLYGDEQTITYNLPEMNGLSFGYAAHSKRYGRKIIDFSELEPDEKNVKRYTILIECKDDRTVAYMFVDGEKVKDTVAKRNPADKFNFRIGAQTAFDRLWERSKK